MGTSEEIDGAGLTVVLSENSAIGTLIGRYPIPGDFYLIRNGRLGPEYDAPKRRSPNAIAAVAA